MAVHTDPRRFGAELKRWRTQRRYSQHELALRSEVSQRHLSYLENGRSRPSPEMIEHLSIALDVPLSARNSLFVAAGFAPAHSEEPLDGERLIASGTHCSVSSTPISPSPPMWSIVAGTCSSATTLPRISRCCSSIRVWRSSSGATSTYRAASRRSAPTRPQLADGRGVAARSRAA